MVESYPYLLPYIIFQDFSTQIGYSILLFTFSAQGAEAAQSARWIESGLDN
jgi:hypothetical protein